MSGWIPARGPHLLMYHGLGGQDGVSGASFESQIDLLCGRLEVVSLARAVDAVGTPRACSMAAITFDDGYADFAEIAVPVLASRGLHATVFVPGAHIGGSNVWDHGVVPDRRLMRADELRALDATVAEVGVHGMEHRRLAGLPATDLERETREARDVVEQAIGRSTRFFAYPYGQLADFDKAAEAAVADAGFSAACSTHFGRGSRPTEMYRLRRIGVGSGDTLDVLEAKLSGARDWVGAKERVGYWLRRAHLRR